MPTDALRAFRDTMLETKEYGFDRLYNAQWDLGNKVRGKLKDKGVNSVAPEGLVLRCGCKLHTRPFYTKWL